MDKEHVEFHKIYCDLIHSGHLTNTIIEIEFAYWLAVSNMLDTRDMAIQELQKKSQLEIERAIEELGHTHTEESISKLSSHHCQDMARLELSWNKSIDALKDTQREEFRSRLKELWLEFKASNASGEELKFAGVNRYSAYSSPVTLIDDTRTRGDLMEESFTINLGAQLKMTHNLRLMAADALSLCNVHSDLQNNGRPLIKKFSSSVMHERIQTAMSLYSNNLSALVLLVDNNFKSSFGVPQDFSRMCHELTEFHFDSLEKQLDNIRNNVLQEKGNRSHLITGDCYITRHSTLANAHVIFHLVTDDSLRVSEINSRHPVILTLRNILRTAHMHDIKTISIPLLLIDEMNEEILTVNWCLRRAELVLKCVKGFLIEMASLSTGVDQGTMQFLVPRSISDDLFTNLSALIPSVFRLSNPLNLKTAIVKSG